MKYMMFIAFLILSLFTACNTHPKVAKTQTQYEKPTPAKEAKFHSVMAKVAMSTRDNPNYNRISLDTPEKKAWFKTLMYRLWDRQITRQQFILQGLKRYPKHRYEFGYIANGFQKF